MIDDVMPGETVYLTSGDCAGSRIRVDRIDRVSATGAVHLTFHFLEPFPPGYGVLQQFVVPATSVARELPMPNLRDRAGLEQWLSA